VIEQDKGLREALLGKKTAETPVLSLEHSEKEQIRQALEAAKGNRTQAARLLGISRATIFRKIKEYELV
jgi:transcriptional regulator of acetoin/glycerol metabolism